MLQKGRNGIGILADKHCPQSAFDNAFDQQRQFEELRRRAHGKSNQQVTVTLHAPIDQFMDNFRIEGRVDAFCAKILNARLDRIPVSKMSSQPNWIGRRSLARFSR